jgi:DNA-binding XRE family transcriptional regulator
MTKKRTKLIAARIEAGFESQDALVAALRKDGVDINSNTYTNIESGRNKTVDVVIAFIIAKKCVDQLKKFFYHWQCKKCTK